MIFKKKPLEVCFHTSEDYVADLYPIVPASVYFSETRKKLAKQANERKRELNTPNSDASAHLCSGLRGLVDSCWVIKAPTDIRLETNGDGISINWEVPVLLNEEDSPVQFFEPHQWADAVQNFPQNTLKTLVKIHTGWSVELPKNHSLMFLPLDVFGVENRFSVFSGPLKGGLGPAYINVVLYWHVLNGVEIIKAGTPLCLLKLVKDNLCDIKTGFSVAVRDEAYERRLKSYLKGLSSVFGRTRHVMYKKLIAGEQTTPEKDNDIFR